MAIARSRILEYNILFRLNILKKRFFKLEVKRLSSKGLTSITPFQRLE